VSRQTHGNDQQFAPFDSALLPVTFSLRFDFLQRVMLRLGRKRRRKQIEATDKGQKTKRMRGESTQDAGSETDTSRGQEQSLTMAGEVNESSLAPRSPASSEHSPEQGPRIKMKKSKKMKSKSKSKSKKNNSDERDISTISEWTLSEDSSYKSHFFRLQLTELLRELYLDYTALEQSFQPWLQRLVQCWSSLPQREVNASEYTTKYGALRLHHANLVFTFHKPLRVEVIGSYATHTLVRPRLNIDLAVLLPTRSVRERDAKDYRYLDISTLYLAVLGEAVQSTDGLASRVELCDVGEDVPRVVLQMCAMLSSASTLSETAVYVRVRTALPLTVIPWRKVRLGYQHLPDSEAPHTQTLYTQRLVEDMLLLPHAALLQRHIRDVPTLQEALVLLKLWLRLRGLSDGSDGWNGHLMSMLLLHLLSLGHVHSAHSSYQVFKITLQFLATAPLERDGVVMSSTLLEPEHRHHLTTQAHTEFQEHFDVIFLDPSQRLNLAARLSRHVLRELVFEAQQTLRLLDAAHDYFEAVFLTSLPFWLRYDYYLSVDAHQLSAARVSKRQIVRVLEQAYGDRILFLRIQPNSEWVWPVVSDAASSSRSPQLSDLVLGLRVNSAHYRRLVDRGPPADDVERARQWCDFWGPKAQIRRFQDGSILQCAVWDDECAADSAGPLNVWQRYRLLHRIARFVLNRHCRLPSHAVHFFGEQFDNFLFPLGRSVSPLGTEVFEVWADLTRRLRLLSSRGALPLHIKELNLVDPLARYTEPLPPLPHPLVTQDSAHLSSPSELPPLYLRPLQAFILFESSGSWPQELTAIQCIKTAFFVRLHEALQKEGVHSVVTPQWLDVVYGGFVFRFDIYYPKEIHLAQSKDPLLAEAKKRTYVDAIALHNRLHALQLKVATFGPTARLAKQWIAHHLLAPFVCDELVELLVAAVYTNPQPFCTSHSHAQGFLRFLHLLATFDWSERPLLVNFDDSLTPEDVDTIRKTFEQHRSQTKAERRCPLWVAYPEDKTDNVWVTARPLSALIWRRVVALARKVLDVAQSYLLPTMSLRTTGDWLVLFTPSVEDFDISIALKPELLPRYVHNLSVTLDEVRRVLHTQHTHYSNLIGVPIVTAHKRIKHRTGALTLLINFDPASNYLHELQTRFAERVLFFHNPRGGAVIYGVCLPTAFRPNKTLRFENSRSVGALPIHDKHNRILCTLPNIAELITEMKTLGQGLVADIRLLPASNC